MVPRYLKMACCFIFITINGQQEKESLQNELKPLPIGNLALPVSQRPRGQFSFGQTVVQKHDLLLYGFANSLKGCDRRLTDFTPILLYGVTDYFSVSVTPSVALRFKKNGRCSRGIEDILVQGEYAFVSRKTSRSVNGAAVVFGLTLPTGSAEKCPPTGLGSPSFFTGIGVGHLSADWYFFIQNGVLITTKHKSKKPGNRFLYQAGVGHNIKSPEGWIYAAIVEFLGTETGSDRLAGILDTTTGSNVISIAPSLWASSERVLIQFGISIPVFQKRPIRAHNDRYYASGGIAWKF